MPDKPSQVPDGRSGTEGQGVVQNAVMVSASLPLKGEGGYPAAPLHQRLDIFDAKDIVRGCQVDIARAIGKKASQSQASRFWKRVSFFKFCL